MQRFKGFVGKTLIPEKVKSSSHLAAAQFVCTGFPEEFSPFEELEFSGQLDDQPLFLCVMVLEGKIKRIMFVVTGKEDPDDVRPLTEEELKRLLDARGAELVKFFSEVTF